MTIESAAQISPLSSAVSLSSPARFSFSLKEINIVIREVL